MHPTRVPANGTSLAQYPRNIPARHPRSVLSEFGIGTRRVGEFHVGGCVLLNAPSSQLIGNRERLSGNVTRKLFERWSGMREAREMFRDCCIAKRSTKDPDYFTERRAKFLPWSGYLISQLRRLRSEFRNASTSDLNSSPWFDWKGEGKNRVLFYSSLESTRNIQIFDPNWIESSRKILLKIVDWVSRRLDERLDLFLFEKIRNEMKDIKR